MFRKGCANVEKRFSFELLKCCTNVKKKPFENVIGTFSVY